jgi:hypothetical protein
LAQKPVHYQGKPLIGGRALVYFGKSAEFLPHKYGLHSINFLEVLS